MRILPGLILMLLLFSACQSGTPEQTPGPPEKAEAHTPEKQSVHPLFDQIMDEIPDECEQLVLVHAKDEKAITGELLSFEWTDKGWKLAKKGLPINLGKNGFAAKDQKVEGDGQTPSGLFALGPAFGYENDIQAQLPFAVLQADSYWDSDSESPTYNQMVSKPPKGEYEVMRRKDHLYKYGVVVQYNMNPAEPQKGSAIFLHIERQPGSYTAGCISMSEANMVDLIEWLDAGKLPHIFMGVI